MNISEKQLRETIIRVLARIEAEEGLFPVTKKKKIYMAVSYTHLTLPTTSSV